MTSPRVLLTSLLWFLVVGLVGCGDSASSAPTTLTVSPSAITVVAGATVSVTASYTDADGATTPATDATFSVSGATVASVTASGATATVKGIAAGRTSLTVTGRGASATVPIVVNGAPEAKLTKITITPAMPSLAAGTTVQLTATGMYDDSTTKDLTADVTWASATTAAITVDATGLAHAVAIGTSEVSASLGDGAAKITGTTTLTVTGALLTSIEVSPAAPSIALGLTQQLQAIGHFSDSTTQPLTTDLTWSTSAAATATVSTTGLVTSVAVGTATITAKRGALMGSTTVTVLAATIATIDVTPTNAVVAAGKTQQFTAKAKLTDNTITDITATATWTSSTDAATINAAGLATGVHAGNTVITAAAGGKTGTAPLTVSAATLTDITLSPLDATASAGTKVAYHAQGKFSDNSTSDITTQVTWDSSNAAVAVISNAAGTKGEASALTPGTVTISAALDGITKTTTLTVSDAVLVSIAVEPATASIAAGLTRSFKATGTFSDTTTQDITAQVTWSSSAAAIASVSNAAGSKGLVTAIAVGDATITATSGAIHGDAQVTVTAAEVTAIAVAPATASIAVGATQQFTATGSFTDHVDRDITATATWTSSAVGVATISTAGLATGVGGGTTTITAAVGAINGTASLTVAGLQIVSVTPPDAADQIRTSTGITVTFDTAVDPATLTTQTVTDVCSGSIQLSKDNFVTCVGFATAAPTLDATGKIASAFPAASLALTTSYKIRVLGTVKTAAGVPFGLTFTQATAWKTAGGCAPKLVISQIYGGGGNSGGAFSHDFIELHNVGTTPIDLTGLGIQYNSAAGTGAWQTQALPSVTVQPGAYFLIQEAIGANNPPQAELPTPDFIPTTTINGQAGVVGIPMSATNGRVALTTTATPIGANATCAAIKAASVDVVGYGTANCFEGGTAAGGTLAGTGARRLDGGCIDTDVNGSDFEVVTPTPRNSTTSGINVCSCPLAGFEDEPAPQMSFLAE